MNRETVRGSAVALRRKGLALVWGDRMGLLVFLLALCLFGLVWRTSFLITDTYTIANGVYALQHGSLDMTTAAYGPGLETPGAEYYDGRLYSRNYGVIVAAVPFVFLLEAAAHVVDLRIALIAVWCLLVLASALLAGRIFDSQRAASYGGSLAVLVLFAVNVALATPLDPIQSHLIALQIVHVIGAAFVAVFTYRLVGELHDRRRALAATALVTLGTPLAFWAAVPKRHVLTAAVALAVALAIARSRDGDRRYATTSRALAYALVGLLAWVHAPEALVLAVALVVVDVPTAPTNDARTLVLVGCAFLASLVPMMATNLAITGDPLTVPRSLRNAPAGVDLSFDAGSGTGGDGGPARSSTADGTSTPSESGGADAVGGSDASETDDGARPQPTPDGDGGTGRTSPARPGVGSERIDGHGGPFGFVRSLVLVALALFGSALEPMTTLGRLVADGLSNVVTQPSHLYHAVVRSGYVDRVARSANDAPAANLSLLESAPLLAGALAFVPVAVSASRSDGGLRRLAGRFTAVDAFVVVLAVGYTLVYASRLPIHAQVTVRYLFPLYPLAVYGLVRLPPIGVALTDHWRTFAWTYAGSVLLGGQLLLVALVVLGPGRGEAFQFHALVALSTAGLVGSWSLTGRTEGRWGRFGAASLALATAAATTFVLFVSVEYYALGDSHALPMVRAVAELVSLA